MTYFMRGSLAVVPLLLLMTFKLFTAAISNDGDVVLAVPDAMSFSSFLSILSTFMAASREGSSAVEQTDNRILRSQPGQ